MVVKVRLEGLNIVPSNGRYYVYFRDTGESLLKGFTGTLDDLYRRLAESDMIGAYNARRKRNLNQIYAAGTLGSLVEWFETECPRYEKLGDATKKDYRTNGCAPSLTRRSIPLPRPRSTRCATAAPSRKRAASPTR
jgi:hypothetical protein